MFFFSGFPEKKKTEVEKIELVSNPQTLAGKKNTVPLATVDKFFFTSVMSYLGHTKSQYVFDKYRDGLLKPKT